MIRQNGLRSVLRALSRDEGEVDWKTAEAESSDDSRPVLAELKVIKRIADAHAGMAETAPVTSATHTSHDSSDQWGSLKRIALIGRGADGHVFHARDERLERDVALKMLRAAPDAQMMDVLAEARLLARIRHPNVVTVYGADIIDGQAGIWMERITGETLQATVTKRGPFGPDEAAVIGAEVCRGVAAIHAAGVLHRDIKAQNVMRASGGRIVVMDFSISRSHDATKPGLAGTPAYVAPELFTGAAASVQSDIYSVGVLLYYLVTGTYPVSGQSIPEIARAHESAKWVRVRDARPDLPTGLVSVIDRALSPEPSHRYSSAGELEGALLALLTRSSDSARPSTWSRRALATAASVAIMAAVVTALWLRGNSTPSAPSAADARPWILLAAFDNQTESRDLDDVLEHALERELLGSSRFRVVPRSRIDDSLQLMRRPAGTRLDPSLARELAQRDGGIPTYITGRLSQVGATTVLNASVIDVRSGATLAALTEDAADLTATPDAMRRLSRQLREALGETLAQSQPSIGLERVTTPSMKALRLYTDAYTAGAHNEWSAALTFAVAAVEADPSFAAAHAWLAWAMMRNRLPRAEYLATAAKAVSLAGNTAEWERLWITATQYHLLGDEGRALPLYEAMLKLNPEHFWATANLVALHRRAGRDADALGPAMQLLELQPHDYNTLYVVLDLHRRLARLDHAVDYARRIQHAPGYNANPSGDAWVVEPFLAWSRGDPDAQVQGLRSLRSAAVAHRHELRDAVLARAAALFVAAGRTSEARDTLESSSPSAQRQAAELLIAVADERYVEAGRLALAVGAAELPPGWSNQDRARLWTLAVWVASRHATLDETRHLYASINERMRPRDPAAHETVIPLLEAELALAAGQNQRVVELLLTRNARALAAEADFRMAETLAEAQIRQRDVPSALRTLEQASAVKHLAAYDASYWWMRCQVRLAELYVLSDRKVDAARLAGELANMLRLADTGFPMTQRVQAMIDATGR